MNPEKKPLLASATSTYSGDLTGAGQETNLLALIAEGNLSGVNRLLTLPGIDISQAVFYKAEMRTPLVLAVGLDRGDNMGKIVNALLLAGANPNVKSAIYFDTQTLLESSFQRYICCGGPNGLAGAYAGGETLTLPPLAVALLLGRDDMALDLIAAGANVNETCTFAFRFSDPIPFLHLAILNCKVAVVSAMLDKGADKNVKSRQSIGKWTEISVKSICFAPAFVWGFLSGAMCCVQMSADCTNNQIGLLSSKNYNATELADNLGKSDMKELLERHINSRPPLLNSQPRGSITDANTQSASVANTIIPSAHTMN